MTQNEGCDTTIQHTHKVSEELSQIIVYFQSMKLRKLERLNFKQVCSISESELSALMKDNGNLYDLQMLHQNVCTRVYPKGLRQDSGNMDPMPAWHLSLIHI